MTKVTIPEDGDYSDAGETPQDMQNGGHRRWLLPMIRGLINWINKVLVRLEDAYNAVSDAEAQAQNAKTFADEAGTKAGEASVSAQQAADQVAAIDLNTIARTTGITMTGNIVPSQNGVPGLGSGNFWWNSLFTNNGYINNTLSIGTTSALPALVTSAPKIRFVGAGVGQATAHYCVRDDALAWGSDYIKGRGTDINAPQDIQSNDYLGLSYYGGYINGSAVRAAAQYVQAEVVTPGENRMGSRFVWATRSNTTGTGWINRLVLNSGGNLYPNTDNIYSCGVAGFRWADIYAANGVIQTSDERTKTNIENSVLGLNFINQLRPVSYKFTIGGQRVIESDEQGNPTKIDKQAGNRTHWGLIAQEVKEVIDKYGVDFGGWILEDKDDPNSQQGLRYDQFIAPLIKAVQELSQQNEAMHQRIRRLEQLAGIES